MGRGYPESGVYGVLLFGVSFAVAWASGRVLKAATVSLTDRSVVLFHPGESAARGVECLSVVVLLHGRAFHTMQGVDKKIRE